MFIRREIPWKGWTGILCCLALSSPLIYAQAAREESNTEGASLVDLSLEDLANVKVTSVSKKAEKRTGAAAAIFAITQDDIRHAGVTNIPDALRMVPGVSVAQLDSNKWAVSARGFNGRYANKLLVLVDGRNVYSPLFSGVYWETLDLVLEDIDRIEVIRGPGGTMWGANAVNGVINIITKSPKDTQGGLASVGAGTVEQDFASLRYGGKLGQDTFYRISGKYFDRDAGKLASGRESNDNWSLGEGSFRIDSKLDEDDSIELSGNLFENHTRSLTHMRLLLPPYAPVRPLDLDFVGGHLMARWSHEFTEDSKMQLQTYYDHAEFVSQRIDDNCDTFDVDFQHQFRAGERHGMVWGLGFRYIDDSAENTEFMKIEPPNNGFGLFSAFLSDEIALVEDRLRLSVGSKFEYNDFTGSEIQPSVSLTWTPDERNTVWTAVSRAVRTPALFEDFGTIRSVTAPFIEGALMGKRSFESEELTAFELGYRFQVSPKLAFDAAVYYNLYRNLRSIELHGRGIQLRALPPRLFVPFQVQNNADADNYGFELAVDAAPAAWWRVRTALTLYRIDFNLRPKTVDITTGVESGNTPEKQIYMQNSFNLSKQVGLNWTIRYCDRLKALDVPSYFTMDAGLNWRVSKDLEFSLVGQNLLEPRHFEFAPEYVDSVPTQVERGAYAKLSWTF